MEKEELKKVLLERKTFTIPSVQNELKLSYKEIRDCVRQMQDNNELMLTDEMNYTIIDGTQRSNAAVETGRRRTPNNGVANGIGSYFYDRIDKEATRRRRELMERLARISEDYDDNEYDDDDDEEDSDSDVESQQFEYNSEILLREIESCRAVDGVEYQGLEELAQKIADRMAVWNIKLKLYAIQFGVNSTRFVFNDISKKNGITNMRSYASDIQACIAASKVNIVAPFGYGKVAVVAYQKGELDPLCKKALNFWLDNNGGRATINSVLGYLSIGFNRAGKMVEQLEKIKCLTPLSSDQSSQSTLRVAISKEDIDVLFPTTLGWES